MKALLVIFALSFVSSAFAQEGPIEMLRRDLKTQKVGIMGASLPLTDAQGEKFWPIYREYDNELSKLGDRRLAAIKKYAARYDSLDEKLAGELVDESISIANDRNDLLEKYYKKVSKAIGVIPATRFLQIENQILTLLDAQLIDDVPLVKMPAAAAGVKK
jgi:hypothetical protein